MTDLERAPILRVMPGPADINANGHIFGGWVLSQMDIAAGIVASRRARGPVATVAIEAMKFIAPIHLRDLISVYADVERVGRTSMGVRIEVVAHRDLGATEVKVTEGSVHLRGAGREQPSASSRPGLSSRRHFLVACRAGGAFAVRRRGRGAAVSSSPAASSRADRRRKHVERKAVTAAVQARTLLGLLIVLVSRRALRG